MERREGDGLAFVSGCIARQRFGEAAVAEES
jgi:hypothetical protein